MRTQDEHLPDEDVPDEDVPDEDVPDEGVPHERGAREHRETERTPGERPQEEEEEEEEEEEAGTADLWAEGDLTRAVTAAARVLDTYVQDSQRGRAPVLRQTPPGALAGKLRLREWIARGGMTDEDLTAFLTDYLDESTRLHHPGYLAHQCAVPGIGAAVADLVHGVSNNAMSLYEMGAPGVAAESAVIRWMAEKAGWPADTAGGALVHGGSLANLTALLAARARAFPDAWDDGTPPGAVVLAPANAHLSVARAAAVLGLGRRAVHPLPCDGLGRVRGEAVADRIAAQHRAGRRVLAVVANACAAPTGLYDPLPAIAGACREHGVWLQSRAPRPNSASRSSSASPAGARPDWRPTSTAATRRRAPSGG